MQLEKTGNYIEIVKIKIKDDKVLIDYKNDDKKIERIKISYQTYEEHFLKEGSLLKSELEKIIKEDTKNKIKKYISTLLMRKPYSKNDLLLKCLDKYKNDKILVYQVIKEAERAKIIDDREYILTYLEYFNNSLYGKYYITNYFHEKEISSDIIDEIKFDEEYEKEKAKRYFELIKNKYVSSNFAKQKRRISETMLKRGFDLEIINDLLKSLNINHEVEKRKLMKEYLKLKEKDLKKEHIISSLVNKGYELEEVEALINSDNSNNDEVN